MIPWRRIPTLLLVVALAWHGVLLTLPHDHEDAVAPRSEADCGLMGAASIDHHLHQLPETLPARHCLACLAGHAVPLFRGRLVYGALALSSRVAPAVATVRPASTGTVLPAHRGPPASV